MTRPRRSVALATLAYVTGLTTHTTFAYYLAPLALRAAGLRDHDAWVYSGVAVAMMLTVVPAGWLADRVPRRHVLAAGLALQALVALPLVLLAPSFAWVLAGTALTGVGLGLMVVSFNAYVADVLAASEVTPAFGLTSAASVLGSALGPVLAALLLRAAPGAGLHLAAAPFAVAPLAGALVALALPSARSSATPPALRAPIAPELARAAAATAEPPPRRSTRQLVVPVMVMYVILGAGYGMTAPYFTTYFLDHVGLPGDAWGLVLGLATAASAAGALTFAQVATRTGHGRRVVLASQVALALACAAFLLPLGALALAGAFLVRSAASNGVGPVVNGQLAREVPTTRRAQAQGFSSFAWNAGWASGGAAGGALLATLGGGAFALGGALGLAGVALGLWLMRSS